MALKRAGREEQACTKNKRRRDTGVVVPVFRVKMRLRVGGIYTGLKKFVTERVNRYHALLDRFTD